MFSNYVTEVEGYSSLVFCAQNGYGSEINAAYFANCPLKGNVPASAYVSCLCAKNSDDILFAITRLVTTVQACSASEAASAASVFTNLCAKANVQLGGSMPNSESEYHLS